MKYMIILIVLLWCSVGFGEVIIEEGQLKSYTIEQAIKAINKEGRRIDNAILREIYKIRDKLEQQLAELTEAVTIVKAEVEELRKMVEAQKPISGIDMSIFENDPYSYARHGPTCYCKSKYPHDKPLCYYWPNTQKECVLLPKDIEELKENGWVNKEGKWIQPK